MRLRGTSCDRWRPSPQGIALTVLAIACAVSPGAVAAHRLSARRTPMGGAPRSFAVALAVPSAGDVSYGVARVRIAAGLQAPAPARQDGGLRVFSGRIGGLAIAARSPQWRMLRRSTRVYVVVSRVQGADASARDVAFFILRRRTTSRADRSPGGVVAFTIANARPAIGAFWVRDVDSRGYADIFEVRNILATALGNWGRYLAVLSAAHALAAAMHPLIRTSAPARSAIGGSASQALWTGGQRPSARVRAIFRLIMSTIGNPSAYAAAKKNPIVPDFIAHELGNPQLARRWRAVTAELPLEIPDRYAAAAQEEARFARVRAPSISPRAVTVVDPTNSSSEAGDDAPKMTLEIQLVGHGSGRVISDMPGVDCRSSAGCVHEFAQSLRWTGLAFVSEPVRLTATPDPRSSFGGWTGCSARMGLTCVIDFTPNDVVVTVRFDIVPATLTVIKNGRGTGTVTSDPAGIDCGSTCSAAFPTGARVVLTAVADSGGAFAEWSGCGEVINTVGCGLDLTGDRTVTVTFTGPMTRIAGTGTFCSSPPNCNDNRPATSAQLNSPEGLAVDAAGNLYIADTSDQEIREVLTDGTITRIAGTGATCSVPGCGDGNAATSAQLYNPGGVAVDSRGNVYVADTFNQEIRRFSPGGAITTIAGSQGRFCDRPPNCGDGGPATAAQLDQPLGLAADGSGNVYVADAADNEIRKFAPGGTITTIAGTGGAGGFLRLCDDGAATAAQLDNPEGVAVDASGNVFIADTGHNEVCEVTAANMIRRIAGTGFQCQPARQCDHGSAAVDADLNQPEGVAVDSAGNVYVADTGDNEVRRISPDGTITTLASGLHHPFAVTVDSGGNVYIADTRDHEVLEAG